MRINLYPNKDKDYIYIYIYTIDFIRQWIIDVNGYQLPIRFPFIEQGHDAKNLDLFDLSSVSNLLSNLTYIDWIVISTSIGVFWNHSWIFPSL